MNTVLIVVALILWGGFRAYRKAQASAAPEEGDAQSQPRHESRPAFESLFGEVVETAPAKSGRSKKHSSREGRVRPPVPQEVCEPFLDHEAPSPEGSSSSVSEPSAPLAAFDLRQAVIYDAVLNNRYLS